MFEGIILLKLWETIKIKTKTKNNNPYVWWKAIKLWEVAAMIAMLKIKTKIQTRMKRIGKKKKKVQTPKRKPYYILSHNNDFYFLYIVHIFNWSLGKNK